MLFVFHRFYSGFHTCELIRKRRIEARRVEIAANAQEVFKAVETETAKQRTFEELKSYLLADDDE